ncbi:MAG TPA: signal peptide peptidase SppA [Kiritimatiellia bacterium]|nr:signal peptide peptidase SppA [Kiritimatiellia bacterium]HRZ11059.1 signal peptide peptidase SppA [Kiritimatiellia bacterium]HSA18632.1 signal peptide peptidase SppA [Kiritimatiellia bacterium]
MDKTHSGSHVGFWAVILLLLIALVGSLAMNAGLLLGRALTGWSPEEEEAEDEFPAFDEVWSWGEGEAKVVRIPIQGELFHYVSEGSLFSPSFDPIESILRQIRAAQNDEDVVALILEVSSPGGDMTSADEIYQAVQKFKASGEDRRVIAHVQDLAASGGYYAILPADRIVAEPTAMLGSIGVIMQTLNWKTLGEKLGIADTTIKSGEHKDLLNPFREVSEEQRAILQKIVDSAYSRFFDLVVTNRGVEPAKLRELADGRVFDASVALEGGLIDDIGYWTDVLDQLPEVTGEDSVKIVRYSHSLTFSDWLGSVHARFRWPRWIQSDAPRLMYLWRP